MVTRMAEAQVFSNILSVDTGALGYSTVSYPPTSPSRSVGYVVIYAELVNVLAQGVPSGVPKSYRAS